MEFASHELDHQATRCGRIRSPQDLGRWGGFFYFHHARRYGGQHHDPVLEFTKTASSLKEAIERACTGMTAGGVKFRHDQHLRRSAVKILQRRLIENRDAITTANNFDELHDLIDNLKPKYIGALKVYDVSMRIGAYLKNIEQSAYCYLHRGALVGWQNMTGKRARPYRVPLDSMPAALRVLPHYMLEDFFCEHRTWLKNPELLMREATTPSSAGSLSVSSNPTAP